jgi:hypothetical protein
MDSWTVDMWVRWNALPGAGVNQFVYNNTVTTNIGAVLFLNNNVGTIKLLLSLSSNGSSADIANATLGTKTSWATNTWYHIALVFDALAGKYFVYVDGVQDQAVTSTSRICKTALLRLGSDHNNANAFNGWIDSFRFLRGACLYPNGTTFTPPAAAAAVTDAPVHFFSIPEMKMYEITSASASAGTDPGMTQRNRVFLGEATTSGVAVTSARSYAYRGRNDFQTASVAAGTAFVGSHNIGTIPLVTRLDLVNTTQEGGYRPADVVTYMPNYFDGTTQRAYSVFLDPREVRVVTASGVGAVVQKTANNLVALNSGAWRFKVYLSRGW